MPRRETMQVHWIGIGGPIPPDRWGKDHKSTLVYVESRAVDYGGKLSAADPKMRMDGHRYPTTLADGTEILGHDDYMCLRDAEGVGFIKYDEDAGLVEFTDAGWEYVHRLRRERAERGLAIARGLTQAIVEGGA